MPELPEVETIMRGLAPWLTGCVLRQVIQRRDDLRRPLPDNFAARLRGRRVLGLRRRAKHLLIDLNGDETWMVHLGMSGRMQICQNMPAQAGPHDHVIVHTDRGQSLIYTDARRFGAMDLWPTPDLAAHPQLAKLGPEPLGNDFNTAYLGQALARRNSPIKTALLDQHILAGLGNIYVCEALFRASIAPERAAKDLASGEIDALSHAIVATLRDAIAAGGTSLRDYRQADGALGYFQHDFQVYGRAEAPCLRQNCPGMITRIVQSGRATFFCPACQH